MEYDAVCCTDKGIKKSVNQDSACVMIADTSEGQICMALLCDGMGGIAMGECASYSVINRFVEWFEHKLPYRIQEKVSFETAVQEWNSILIELDEQLRSYGLNRQIKLGTTATCMFFWKNRYFLAQMGDSRAYSLNKRIMQLSEDQSFVQKQINTGNLTEMEAKFHPKRNVLTDCVGGSRPSVPVCRVGKLHSDEIYLLCSDGFVHELENEEIFHSIYSHKTSDLNEIGIKLEDLIQKAIERGEIDNITALVVRVKKTGGLSEHLKRHDKDNSFHIIEKIVVTEGTSLLLEQLPTTETDE